VQSRLSDLLGVDLPVFGFSHCRDVVAEVTRAGGVGVLGTMYLTLDELERDLAWIEARTAGGVFGIDTVAPNVGSDGNPEADRMTRQDRADRTLAVAAERMLDLLEVRAGAESEPVLGPPSMESVLIQLDLLAAHGGRLFVNARGVVSSPVLQRARERGLLVGALAGSAAHARKHRGSGIDLVVAQGFEAAGHTSTIGTMVLVPEVVEAAAPLPVLAAGGIATGRQVAAARALGADGVWMGTAWLAARESELTPQARQRVIQAASSDAVLSQWYDGVPGRQLSSPWTEAWERSGTVLHRHGAGEAMRRALGRIRRAGRDDLDMVPAGQVVGLLHRETTVKEIVVGLVEDYLDAVADLGQSAGLRPDDGSSPR
jgi:NAD(P)H-dependent flavin oxidoreductase YrpB (nitropropane dioxygenase family)